MCNSQSTGVNDGTQQVDSSSGFHMLEIHAPTAGFNIVTMLLVMLAALLAWACIRRYCSSTGRRGRRQTEALGYEMRAFPAPTVQPAGQPDVLQQMTSVANLINAMDRRRDLRALEYTQRPSPRITTLREDLPSPQSGHVAQSI